jgi:hypothetical protein
MGSIDGDYEKYCLLVSEVLLSLVNIKPIIFRTMYLLFLFTNTCIRFVFGDVFL